ncbi:hypothetical protein Rin_00013620 [Candidatus Regiella insecticola 5.15]|uniref:Uncharacterized protein n=1 Tax=Candidatus Regiella insecticola 5.15 TaxID=1005043 RepID=G2GZY2_9ENTR|nr:hypothetical protein [Candidatus Regiella insecticola]EGY28701.1 hypothetical protein Rin_00013620 [Candidatus Regiella insecticola 5.15]
MDHTKTFKSEYLPLFERVCVFLGEGWRVNKLQQNDEHQIKLTNPTLKNYSIVARLVKNRIMIYGSIDYHYYHYGKLAKCTISLTRNARAVAKDIKRKVLITAVDEINKANQFHQKERENKEQKRILKGMLAQQVKLKFYHNAITDIVASSGINGRVKDGYDGYQLKLYRLTTDQLIEIVGFISLL